MFAPRLVAIVPLALLAGCVSFGAEPTPSLLTLKPSISAPAGSGASAAKGEAITIIPFDAPQRLDVTRVPVQVTDSEVAYLKDAVWVEKPARLMRRLVAETLRTQTQRVVIDGDDPGVASTTRLRGTLREFGYDVRQGAIVVRFDAIRHGAAGAVETRRFEATVPGVPAEAAPVGRALNDAANDVAGQIAEWMGGQ